MPLQPFNFAGRTLTQLSEITGSNPAYVYSRNAISERIKQTREILPHTVDLHYSLKANPNPLVLSHVAAAVDGLDVSSHAELLLALGTGLTANKISFSGPGKSVEELRAAICAGIVLHIESLNELDRVVSLAKTLGQEPHIALRVNPDFNVRQSGMVMGGGAQPFGMDLEHVDEAIQRLSTADIRCEGIHCYAGSQMLNAQLVSALQAQTLDMMLAISERHNLSGMSYNIGGGFGIPYSEKDKALDITHIGQQLKQHLDARHLTHSASPIIIELGRFLVGEAGLYLARVVEKKRSRGKQFLVLQGGMNHNLAASGNLGQIIRRNYPVVGHPQSGTEAVETVTVVGPLCTPLDVLATDVQLPVMEIGDVVAVLNSGAYGFSASPQGFLSHPPPVELLV